VVLDSSRAAELREAVLEEIGRCGLDSHVRMLRERLPEGISLYLVGGFIRDVLRSLIGDHRVSAKDADIAVNTSELAFAVKTLGGSLSRSALGGYRWQPLYSSFWIDLWELEDTIWIQRLGLSPNLYNLLDGMDLNIDRIAFGLHDCCLVDRGCYSGVTSRTIDLDARYRLAELEADELARAVVAHIKTGYRLSARILCSIQRFDTKALLVRATERLSADGYPESTLQSVRNFIAEVRRLDDLSFGRGSGYGLQSSIDYRAPSRARKG
jgi:hypothetical protein